MRNLGFANGQAFDSLEEAMKCEYEFNKKQITLESMQSIIDSKLKDILINFALREIKYSNLDFKTDCEEFFFEIIRKYLNAIKLNNETYN